MKIFTNWREIIEKKWRKSMNWNKKRKDGLKSDDLNRTIDRHEQYSQKLHFGAHCKGK